ncbi:MAG: ThiF family adenylyltransferase [Acidobacteria bacterium]|nr:ThiF family adenylyltransferase [Acidobacteriota bacterium]
MAEKYSRQVLFNGIGKRGQELLRTRRIVVLGCGALGTVNAEVLVRAGVGSLLLVDRDFVEESNLQRQSLFSEEHARRGLPKAIAAQQVLSTLNSDVKVEGIVEDISFENIEQICGAADLFIDGTDNFETRFLLNDFAVKTAIPWIYGACVGSYGIAFAIRPAVTACLRCWLEDPPARGSLATCDTAGVIAPVVHAVAAFQSAAALKLLCQSECPTNVFQIDVWKDSVRMTPGQPYRPDCLCCVQRTFEFLEGKEKDRFVRLCGRNAVQIYPRRQQTLDFKELSRRLEKSGKVLYNDFMMKIDVNGYEIALFCNGRSIIRGTEDIAEARAVYSRYIGN